MSSALWFLIGLAAGAALGLTLFCEALARRRIEQQAGGLLDRLGVTDPRIRGAVGSIIRGT